MLGSITPLGERGRNATWGITVTAFVIGATAAGAVLGAALAKVGATLMPASVGAQVRLLAVAAAVALALGLDAVARTVPGPRRQVNERWLDEYRGWVYGLGYGAQLGVGVTTVVSSAATYVALLAALLVAQPGAGALILGCFGAIRGLTLLAGARIRTPPQLLSMHRALARWRLPARWGGVGVLSAILVAAVMCVAT
jgi:hypothetical protein